MKMKSNIGNLIDERGLKRKWVAEQLGITPKQVSNWITGFSYPTVDKAFRLAKLLGVKVDDLYEEE
jgi:putative transcriptional regulator